MDWTKTGWTKRNWTKNGSTASHIYSMRFARNDSSLSYFESDKKIHLIVTSFYRYNLKIHFSCFIFFGHSVRKKGEGTREVCMLTHLCRPVRSTFAARETQSLWQQMLNAPVGINGLTREKIPVSVTTNSMVPFLIFFLWFFRSESRKNLLVLK